MNVRLVCKRKIETNQNEQENGGKHDRIIKVQRTYQKLESPL